jgi:serine/threonine protein kinase
VGVLHRDVKPANVMLLRSTGRAVLTDFGIAMLEGDATVTTTGLLLGSPAYMSPERARGEPATLASDLWSLGATLYAAIDGRSPFERSGSLPTVHAVMHDPAPVLAHSGELSDVIAALLTKDPAGRPSLGEHVRRCSSASYGSSRPNHFRGWQVWRFRYRRHARIGVWRWRHRTERARVVVGGAGGGAAER